MDEMIQFYLEVEAETGEICHDFSFHLREGVRYQKWRNLQSRYTYSFLRLAQIKSLPCHHQLLHRSVPVGSIEFVLAFYEHIYQIPSGQIKPINIPSALWKAEYLKRQVVSDLSDWRGSCPERLFIKEQNRFKGLTDIVQVSELAQLNQTLILSEEITDLISEWRGFILNGQLVDIRLYSGDYRQLPDEQLIQSMVSALKGHYRSYTLDVGVRATGETCLIEVHQFFSCGLYGMTRTDLLPMMFYATHLDLIIKMFFSRKLTSPFSRHSLMLTVRYSKILVLLYIRFLLLILIKLYPSLPAVNLNTRPCHSINLPSFNGSWLVKL